LDDARSILKTIRNTEKSVQPSRDNRQKIQDEIHKLKMKEPENTRLVVLEQELVRAEAENLVAEAQLTNIVCHTAVVNPPNVYSHNSRLVKSSRRLTPPSSPPPSSAQRSRSFSPATAAAC
jgi:hypothetical protein